MRRPSPPRDSWFSSLPASPWSSLRPTQVLLVIGLASIADSAAYFAGRAWGRHKLAPSISPGKSWEGAAAGLVAGLAYAIICAAIFDEAAWLPYAGGAALLVVMSIFGDLFESAAEAAGRGEGQRLAAARPRRRAGSHRQRDRHPAGGGAALALPGRESTVNLAVLGATGSIGASTLDVAARHPERYRVFALSAHASADALLELCRAHKPRYAVLSGRAGEPRSQEADFLKRRQSFCSARARSSRSPRIRTATR